MFKINLKWKKNLNNKKKTHPTNIVRYIVIIFSKCYGLRGKVWYLRWIHYIRNGIVSNLRFTITYCTWFFRHHYILRSSHRVQNSWLIRMIYVLANTEVWPWFIWKLCKNLMKVCGRWCTRTAQKYLKKTLSTFAPEHILMKNTAQHFFTWIYKKKKKKIFSLKKKRRNRY